MNIIYVATNLYNIIYRYPDIPASCFVSRGILDLNGLEVKQSSWQLWLRHAFGFSMNNCGWNLIAYTCPLFLMRPVSLFKAILAFMSAF